VQLGLINTIGTSNKALMTQKKDKSKNPKKKCPCQKNKKNKGTKPSPPTSAPNGDKGRKYKSNKTNIYRKFCEKDGYVESKCFKNMEALEVAMKKHNISIQSSYSNSSSHGHALYASSFSFNATSNSYFEKCIIDYGESYHPNKDKAIFSALNECNTKQIFVGNDRSISFVGYRTI
jgi:hypothetical protein